MRKISWSCVIVGVISIVLSISGIFLHSDPEITGYNLPFQFLLISLKLGAIAIPKSIFSIFVNALQIPLFDYIFSTVLAISGIGTIWIKPWGRTFVYIYAMSIILISAIGFPIILRGYIKEFSHIEKYGFFEGLVWGGALLYILILIGTLLYPIILLIFFSRPKIKEIFSAKK